MTPPLIQRELKRFCAWYRLTRSWRFLQIMVFAASLAVGLYILCRKLVYVGLTDVSVVALALLGVAVVGWVGYFLFVPGKANQVSYLLDKRAGLKNLVGAGLSVAPAEDEASRVIVQRAEQALRVAKPRTLFPFELNWAGRHVYIPAIVLVVSLLLPDLDLLGRQRNMALAAEEKVVVQEGALRLAATVRSLGESQLRPESVEGKNVADDYNVLAKDLAEMTRQEALLELGEFESKYRKDFSKQRDFEQMARAMNTTPDLDGLSPENQEQVQELLKNLKEGQLSKAGQTLRQLAEQLAGDDLSDDEKRALARELNKVAEQLGGEGSNSELAKLLSEIEASSAPLDELMKQCKLAGNELDQLAGLCQESEAMKSMKDGLKEAKQCMLGDQFSDFDAKDVESYLEQEATLGGTCEGFGMGMGMGEGSGGTGGEGKGRGGAPPENRTVTAFKNELSPSQLNKGTILNQLFISGVPEKGEALVEYRSVAQAARQHAAGYLAQDVIPRESEEMVKRYFDSLEPPGTPE